MGLLFNLLLLDRILEGQALALDEAASTDPDAATARRDSVIAAQLGISVSLLHYIRDHAEEIIGAANAATAASQTLTADEDGVIVDISDKTTSDGDEDISGSDEDLQDDWYYNED
jgi:hypothetical protein